MRQAEGFFTRGTTAEKMGVAYAGLRESDRAGTEYRRVLWYEPHNPEVRDRLIVLLLEGRQFADAAKEAEAGLRWNPDRRMLHLNLEMGRVALGQEAEALTGAQKAGILLRSNRTGTGHT